MKKVNTSFSRDRFFIYLILAAGLLMWIAAFISPSIREAIGTFDLLIALPFIVGGSMYALGRLNNQEKIQQILDKTTLASQKAND